MIHKLDLKTTIELLELITVKAPRLTNSLHADDLTNSFDDLEIYIEELHITKEVRQEWKGIRDQIKEIYDSAGWSESRRKIIDHKLTKDHPITLEVINKGSISINKFYIAFEELTDEEIDTIADFCAIASRHIK